MDAETQAVLFNAVPLLVVAALYLAVGLRWRLRCCATAERSLFVALAMTLRLSGASAVAAGIVAIGGAHRAGAARRRTCGSRSARFCSPPSPRSCSSRPGATRARSCPECAAHARRRSARRCATASSSRSAACRARSWTRATPRASRESLLDELARSVRARRCEPLRSSKARAVTQRANRRRARAGTRQRGADGRGHRSRREPSGISTAVREAGAFSVYDAEASPIVNQRLNAIARREELRVRPGDRGGARDRRRGRGRPGAARLRRGASWR